MDPKHLHDYLGRLRAALEEAESDVLEGRLTRAAERINDARGIATHLCFADTETPRGGDAVLVAVAQVLRARQFLPVEVIDKLLAELQREEPDELYAQFIGPAIDEVERVLLKKTGSARAAEAPAPLHTEEGSIAYWRRRAEEAERREAKMAEQARRLLGHLDGSDGFPPAWWIEAGDAVRQLGQLLGS